MSHLLEGGAADAKATQLRVLLVDRHPATRQALACVLERRGGYEVCGPAADYDEAVELARRRRPHAAVIDVGHADGEATALIQTLRSESPEMRIVAVSLQADAERRQRCRQAGARALVRKDGPLEALLAVLRACGG